MSNTLAPPKPGDFIRCKETMNVHVVQQVSGQHVFYESAHAEGFVRLDQLDIDFHRVISIG